MRWEGWTGLVVFAGQESGVGAETDTRLARWSARDAVIR